MRGFDTSLIAGNDRGGDAFGALTFTRVFGQAWEVHGEAAWREQAAVLLGAKRTTASGVTFIAEFYSPPNIPYYRDMGVSPLAGRRHYAFLNAGKARLRELPGWKEWGMSGSVVANLDDRVTRPSSTPAGGSETTSPPTFTWRFRGAATHRSTVRRRMPQPHRWGSASSYDLRIKIHRRPCQIKGRHTLELPLDLP